MDKNESIEKMDINIKIENVGGIGSEKDSSYAITMVGLLRRERTLTYFQKIMRGKKRYF